MKVHATLGESTKRSGDMLDQRNCILHVVTALPTGGAEMMLLKLISATRDELPQAVVSLGKVGTIGRRISDSGIPVYSVDWNGRLPKPLRLLPLISLVRRLRPQLLVGWLYHGNLAANIASRACGGSIPVLWNIQQTVYDVKLEDWPKLIRFCAACSRRASVVIYNSHVSVLQHQTLGYSTLNGIVIPTGFDCREFRPNLDARLRIRAELGLSDDAVVIGLMARYHAQKDHANFFRAARLIAQRYPAARFLLAGTGMTDQNSGLQTAIVQYQLTSRVMLLGERHDMPALTAALDIACSASAWGEGSSNAVGEAMACGVPCVVTDVGDSALLVDDTGIVVPARDSDRLADAVNRLIEAGPAGRQRLGCAARLRIDSEFSLDRIARRYTQIYQKHAIMNH